MIDIVIVSLKVSIAATVVSLIPALMIAYLLARYDFVGKTLLQATITLPMVLPPVAVGLVLLKVFSQSGPLGSLNLLFTWQAASIAAAVMAFPLLVKPAEQAFRAVPKRLEQVALSLGRSKWTVIRTITLPLAKHGIAYGTILFFLRSLGEFGATQMVAGNIEGQTQTLSLGIYSAVENFDDRTALVLAFFSVALSLFAMLLAERFVKRNER